MDTESRFDPRQAIDLYRRRTVMAIQLALIASVTVAFAVFINGRPVVKLTLLTSLCLSSLSLMLAWRNRTGIAAALVIIQMLGVALGLSATGKGIHDIANLLIPATLLATSIFGRPAHTAAVLAGSLAVTASITTLTILGLNGLTRVQHTMEARILDGSAFVIIVVLTGILSLHLSRVVARLLATFQEQQARLELQVAERTADLSASNQDLRQTLASLEQAKDDLVRSEKQAALGRIVAGVAHELNGPLGTALLAAGTLKEVQGRATFLRDDDQAQARTSVDLVMRSVERAVTMVTKFREIAVDQGSDPLIPCHIAKVVQDVLTLCLDRERRDRHQVSLAMDPDLVCTTREVTLRTILHNLVENAFIHGFRNQNGGTLSIGAQASATLLTIVVSDDGQGIPPDHMAHIFDPFFASWYGKSTTGLGLTIAWNLANAVLKGNLSARSTPGQGTTFTLELPITDPSPKQNPQGDIT